MSRVLVTNDDGIDAPGLHVLARALVDAGHDVLVAAPLGDRSGSGASIGSLGTGGHIHAERREIPGLDGVEAHGLDGPPALVVLAARLGGFGEPPELVVSGINPGPNTGRATLHSGTVGAALTGASMGASALAVSIGWSEQPHFGSAAAMAVVALGWLAEAPARTVLNLNVPDLPVEELRGVRWAELAPFGTVRAVVTSDGSGPLQMELHETRAELPPGSDTALVNAGYVAVTALHGIRAAAPLPVADEMEAWLAARPPVGTPGAGAA